MFDSLTTKIEKAVKTKLINAAENLLSKTTKISEIKLDTPENILKTITNISMQFLGITNERFLVPGLETPALLGDSPLAASHILTLANTEALLKGLKEAEKTFKSLPPEKTNDTHRFETLTYLNLLISNLTNLCKTMTNCKKKCPLNSDYKLQRELREKITNCLNSLIEFNAKIPPHLTNDNVLERFYKPYGRNLLQVRQLTGQTLKRTAAKNLTKYYESWGVKPEPKAQPKFYSAEDAKTIFNTLQSSTGKSTKITLSDNTQINLTRKTTPFNPSTKIGNEPIDFNYDDWLKIYNTLNDNTIKKLAEESAVKLDFELGPRQLQIKDITENISALAENTIQHLNYLPGPALTTKLYTLFNYTNQSDEKKPTLKNVNKLKRSLIPKLIKKASDLKKLKTQVESKYPYLKIKTDKETSNLAEKMQILLKYDLTYPYSTTTIYTFPDGGEHSVHLPEIKDKQINLKEFKNSLLALTKKICDKPTDNSNKYQTNLATLNLAINLYLDLANSWETQVKNLSKKLDPSRLAKNDDTILKATIYMATEQQIISENPILKALAKKIKALQLTPFGKKTKKLQEYCAKLVAGVELIQTSPQNNTQTIPTLKTENNTRNRIPLNKDLKNYKTIKNYYNMKLPEIKKYPSYYANFKKLLNPVPLNDSLWALSNTEKVNDIFKQFKIYQTNSYNHPALYNDTYKKNKTFLQTILQLPLIANTPQLRTKATSLLKLTEKFKTQYSGTPEDYIELTQKIKNLRATVNNAFYSDMKSYKEQTYKTGKAKMPKEKPDQMYELLTLIDAAITSDTDNLEHYKKFVEILASKSTNSKTQKVNIKK